VEKMEKEKTYKCIKTFSLPKYDEHELLEEEEHFNCPIESIWWVQEESYLSEIRLENTDLGWIEIHKEDLGDYFVEISI
jgi:hypothetical protein